MGSDSIETAQMETLGPSRRDFLSTTDFKENRATLVPVTDLESRRLVNTASISTAQMQPLDLEPPSLSLNEGLQGEQSHLYTSK